MATEITEALKRQSEERAKNCFWASAALFVWLRALRSLRVVFVILPIVFGTLASWDLLSSSDQFRGLTAVLALAAGLVPAVYAALKLDEHLPDAARLAGEYKNLAFRFAELSRVSRFKEFDVYEAEYKDARQRLEKANSEAYTCPEWCFRWASKKINSGAFPGAEFFDTPAKEHLLRS